ncbi:hypothetical protein L0Y40_01185 [Candidatus Wolfebacteria bacterium]|nr:hypothetical protein [Candidatus Wolfebacteria bacterium]
MTKGKRKQRHNLDAMFDVFVDPSKRVLDLRTKPPEFPVPRRRVRLMRAARYSAPIAVFLIVAGVVTTVSFTGRATVVHFYPSVCLGSWQSPERAQGEPETLRGNVFTRDITAVVRAAGEELFCGGFMGDIPEDAAVTSASLKVAVFVGDYNTLSPMRTTDTSTVSPAEDGDSSPSSPQPDASAPDTELSDETPTDISDEASDSPAEESVPEENGAQGEETPSDIPTEESPAEPLSLFSKAMRFVRGSSLKGIAFAFPRARAQEETPSIPPQGEPEVIIEESAPATESDASTEADFSDANTPLENGLPEDGTTEGEESDTAPAEETPDASTDLFSGSAFEILEAAYTLDGTEWLPLGSIAESDIFNGVATLPLPKIFWEELAGIQIRLTSGGRIDADTALAVDAVWIEVDHEETLVGQKLTPKEEAELQASQNK